MDVTIYTTPTCHFCKDAKELFRENNIKYREIDVVKDIKAREEMIRKSGQRGVPVIDIGGKIIIGFDEPEIMEMLGLGE